MASCCHPNRPASAVSRERRECVGTRGPAAGAAVGKTLRDGGVARIWFCLPGSGL